MKITEVIFPRELIEGVLELAKGNHPREVFLLLRGEVNKHLVSIKEFIVPMNTTFGMGFSCFSPINLPVDFTILGSLHSHPSGSTNPSIEDLHNFFGLIMVIIAYPYDTSSIAAYDKSGERLKVRII